MKLIHIYSQCINFFRSPKELPPAAQIKGGLSSAEHQKNSISNAFLRFFSKKTPSIENIKNRVENETEVFSYQPARKHLSSSLQNTQKNALFYPEYLIKETPKEIISPLPDEKRKVLFANLSIPLRGVLRKSERGGHHLSLKSELFQLLAHQFQHESCFQIDFDFATGPSIPVILPSENPLGFVFDTGKEFTFSILRALFVKQYDWPGVDKVCILTICCPELEALRSRLGLSEKLQGHDFHITLGIVKASTPFVEKTYLRTHVGYHPV